MTARGRGYNQSDWDSMKDDYDNSTYDPQYPDDNSSGYVNLDHCRLYITNIPKALNEEGLQAAFSKFGTLVECHVSRDPVKRYGLVAFETPGEAKLAMMKLNRTEPLKLNINIAHKKRTYDNKSRENRDRNSNRDQRDRSYRDDISSGSRSSRKKDNMANGDNMDELAIDEDVGLNSSMDPDLNMELENLKLEQLKLQEAQLQCKHRMLLLKQNEKKSAVQNTTNNRCILPDGRIVVRNVDRDNLRDADGSYGAGAGDSLTIPALQRVGCCVVCGSPAESFCSRCGVTPYCGTLCQRRDWGDRHRAVCHNLKRLPSGASSVKPAAVQDKETKILPPAPLRRPRSPDSGSDRGYPKTFGPPGAVNNVNTRGGHRGTRGSYRNNRSDDRSGNDVNNRSQDKSPKFDKPIERNDKDTRGRRPPLRHEKRDEDEEWGTPSNVTKPPAHVPKNIPEPEPKMHTPKAVIIESPKETVRVVEEMKPAAKMTPTADRKTVPKSCLIELLPVGAVCSLSVESALSPGFACVSLSEDYTEQYVSLCSEEYIKHCLGAKEITPKPGDIFSYLNPADGGWYRARCLSSAQAVLMDAGKLVSLTASDQCKQLGEYADLPEFCCRLDTAAVKVGDQLLCTVLTKDGKVSLTNVDTEGTMEGTVSRWLPPVEQVKETVKSVAATTPVPSTAATTPSASSIPEVPRPALAHNSRVVLIDASAPERVLLRGAAPALQRQFDDVCMEVALYGAEAKPLKESPLKGDTVVAQFTDGMHYRALCKRTNVRANKYMLEYIEYGNVVIEPLEKLYPCPARLSLAERPTVASVAQLDVAHKSFTQPAAQYLDKIKDDAQELILSLTSGAKSAPSGSAARLTLVSNNEDVNKTVDAMCTPDWKKVEQKGGDVIETEVLMYTDLEQATLPSEGCELEILDFSMLDMGGCLSGCEKGSAHAKYIFTTITERMAEYCNSALGKDPYLPKAEELCIAQCPPYPQWFRAVLCEQTGGPGGDSAQICFFDYGNLEQVPVKLLRKMQPEFVRNLPAVVCNIEIRGFPKSPTPDQLARALEFLEINDEGRGRLRVSNCQQTDPGFYLVDAPALIAAMR